MNSIKRTRKATQTPWPIKKHNPPLVPGKPFELDEPLGSVLGFNNFRCRGFYATIAEAKQARAALCAAKD